MKGYKLLQIGDTINYYTDEMKHRNNWYPIKEFSLHSPKAIEGMKPIRRKIKKDI